MKLFESLPHSRPNMNLSSLLKKSIDQVNCNEFRLHLNNLTQYDRYQASEGIFQAATYLKNYFLSLNRLDVTLHEFSTDANWWTFEPPASWTPIQANFKFFINNQILFTIDHHSQPCSIATNSQPWLSTKIINKIVVYDHSTKNYSLYKNALVIIPKGKFDFSSIVNLMEKAGARGFITDQYCKLIKNEYFVGRIELPKNTQLFGFSTTPTIIHKICSVIHKPCTAIITIKIDKTYKMPVLEAYLDLKSTKEIWIVAHLCHPRPGANDNTSGVIGLLEIAKIMSKLYNTVETGYVSVRFILAPEFTGMAAYLHEIVNLKSRKHPDFVVNLDMIGEDLEKCGSKFYIERPLISHISYHQCIIETVAQELSLQLCQQGKKWSFHTSEFLGYSDHALFADSMFNIPATQLCHFPDIYNHSSGDTIENIDFDQLKNIIIITLTFTLYLCEFSIQDIEELHSIIKGWVITEEKKIINSCNINNINQDAKYQMINSILTSYHKIFVELKIKQDSQLMNMITNALLPKEFPKKNIIPNPREYHVIQRKWQGPFNPRAFINQLPPEKKTYITSLLEEKKIYYSIILQLGLSIDSIKTTYEIILALKQSLKNHFDEQFICILLEWMLEYNWIDKV